MPSEELTLRAAVAAGEKFLLSPQGLAFLWFHYQEAAPLPAQVKPKNFSNLALHTFFFFLICFSGKVKNMGVKGGASSHVKSRRGQQGHFSRGLGLEELRQSQRRRKRRGTMTTAMAHPQGRAPLLHTTGRTDRTQTPWPLLEPLL